jgi:predicted CXXCH cytochrome family protein
MWTMSERVIRQFFFMNLQKLLWMKQLLYATIVTVLFLIGCQQETKTVLNKTTSSSDQKQESIPTISISGVAQFVGREACSSCHKDQSEKWVGSHHDLAMQVTSKETVLGDFNNTSFSYSGVISSFIKKDGKFFVNTDGPDGKMSDFEVKYTFGVDPLQQYLIELPGGRMQALSIAWDTRTKDAGGQRWFHLYPNEKIDHNDSLHWTGIYQNWNYMCAECHSTNLKKNYDLKNNSYQTTWSENNVSCEACHGPGSKHVQWAKSKSSQNPSIDYFKGLVISLTESEKDFWQFVPGKNIAQRTSPLASRFQEETCARCHSRRSVIRDQYKHEVPFKDQYRLSLLEEGLYHADGQINDEVYVYGSFLQSKMHRAGVRCSDCHDPHSLQLKAKGNDLCAKCHAASVFNKASHHHHKAESLGSKCISCHMPEKKYMVIDSRRDHSFRIPRPDLSESLGTPNTCNQCHEDKSPKWAKNKTVEWYGKKLINKNHFGELIFAGRSGLPNAGSGLVELLKDNQQPAIARASAIELLVRYPSRPAAKAIIEGLRDPDPLVRMASIGALEIFDPDQRFQPAEHLLSDSVRSVRIEAGRVLSGVPRNTLSEKQSSILDQAIDEYEKVQMLDADRPNAHLNLGILYINQKKWGEAENAYKSSLKIDPSFVQGYINLADLFRFQNNEEKAEEILRSGLDNIPNNPEIFHSLGLLLVRKKRMPEAISALEKAANFRQNNPRFGYVYAVALNSTGQTEKALAELNSVHGKHPYNRDILLLLATMSRDTGRLENAIKFVNELIALAPNDPGYLNLKKQLILLQKK